ncbi:hypothetical protein PISMIDRAFT_669889 [Pisolithus microcarpus 441]|uniref:Uncharacterized protein n=1 Tax=Pisolithus microcarpus 441 TaxID=765257 RepID=A0A0C9Z0G5_9AGAM|nr:hypothetical protein PISMIDRAFT_669889 [Pisolithus microcarpus 441]
MYARTGGRYCICGEMPSSCNSHTSPGSKMGQKMCAAITLSISAYFLKWAEKGAERDRSL